MRRAAARIEDGVSSWVGRESDLAALETRLETGHLVTVLGPGGMGKTRLVRRFASERGASYAAHRGGGAWFCDLSETRDTSDVVASVASTLGVGLAGLDGDRATAERVGHAIAAFGRVLVVLDNFDRVTGSAAATVGTWQQLARSARFLVTSRLPLDLPGEQRWPLAPLTEDDAVDLFVRRAEEVRPTLDADRAVVRDIVDRVDRMPLAIELAASRAAILSLGELRDRLARPLDLLAGPRAVERHASLRRVVLDSLEPLGPAARALFVACAALRNGFTLEAAESVLGDAVVPRALVLDGLATLARGSLLRVGVEAEGVARYGLFETVRDVAEELFASEPSHEAITARHARYYARPGPVDARDLDNVLSAQRSALARTGDPARGRQLLDAALGLEPLLAARGLSRLRVQLLTDALDALAGPGQAEAYLARGFARRELGEAAAARADFERGLVLAREVGDAGLTAVALMRLGGIDDLAGDTPAARVRMHEALALLSDTPRDAVRSLREAELHMRLGHVDRREGRLDAARASILEAVDRYRALGHDEGLASSMYELAVIEMFAGRQADAFARFDEGLAVAQRGGAQLRVGALKTARGCLLQDAGRLTEALEHHAEAARIFEELGSRYREGSALHYLATTFLERGEAGEALALLGRAAERVADVGAPRYEALIASATAIALAASGRDDAAEAAMTRAEQAAARVENEPALAATLRIHRHTLALGRDPARDGAADVALASALARAHPSDDSRFAERMLRAALEGTRGGLEHALVVRAGGAGFALPGSATFVTVPERSPLRRILAELVRRRLEGAAEVLTVDDVIEVGWPAEKIGVDAALNRAYVALASLRKLGLRGILLSTGGGYVLSRAIVVRIAGD